LEEMVNLASSQTNRVYRRIHKIQEPFGEGEDWLQRYLAVHPELLPVHDLEGIESCLKLVGRELNAIDLLFVDERD